jgi:hypothetical protein
VTDDATNGYLFFPLRLLRAPLDGDQYKKVVASSKQNQNSEALGSAVHTDRVVADDFRFRADY